MRLIAHRGFAGVYPENTIRALDDATVRADAVEIDVRRCASGELVVIHDETVDRVTDGTGPVDEHTVEELGALDVLGTGEGVPTLEDALRTIPPEIGANVELKEAGTVPDVLYVARRSHPQIIISSFSPEILAEARDIDPQVPRALVFDEDAVEGLARARDLECTYVHPRCELCEDGFVSSAHHAGMSVNAWTVENRATAERLESLGVDGVIADHWDVAPEPDGRTTS